MTTRTLQIRTPEGVLLTLSLASPVLRGIAVFIDALTILALARVLSMAVSLFRAISPDLGAALFTFAYFLLSFLYAILLEWRWRGQTLGKWLLRLRVVDAQGLRLTFSQITVRNLLRLVDALPFFYTVGGIVAWFSPRCQRLGDLAADTVVVHAKPPRPLDIESVNAGRWNSLRAYPRLEARLRQGVTPDEATLIFRALLRRDALAPESRLALYRELAEDLRQRVAFPPEVTEALSDEPFLRDVLDTLLRQNLPGPSPRIPKK